MSTDHASTRTCLIPDLDDDLVHALAQIEELLITLAVYEEDPDDGPGPFVLPASLAARTALEALGRVQDAVTPTQTAPARDGREQPPAGPAHRGRLLAPDGRYEHRPLRLVVVQRHDLDVLAAAAADLGRALALRPVADQHSELVDALDAGAEAAATGGGQPVTAAHLVEHLARAHGLLDLADTDDTTVLRDRLQAAAGGDVVLTPDQEAAYERVADRANTMWTSSDPLARWTY